MVVEGDRRESNRNVFVRFMHFGALSDKMEVKFRLRGTRQSGDGLWKIIARFNGLPRIRLFLWIVVHDQLLTNIKRVRRHMVDDMFCDVRGFEVESIDHLVHKCPTATSLWIALHRNMHVFSLNSCDDFNIWDECHRTHKQCLMALLTAQQSPLASCGGILRSTDGDWFCGYYRFVGCCSIVEVELWGKCGTLSPLVNTIFKLLGRSWHVDIHHIQRSANKVSYGLAKLAQGHSLTEFEDSDFTTRVFMVSSIELISLFHEDLSPHMGIV
ncbi:hypothetical protein GQ457_01G035130 [Hibiscus cannabinus]